MIKNTIASIRQKLLNKARKENRLFDEILQFYAMERYLLRLSQTPYSSNFVLKGALLLKASGIGQTRPTRDIDLSSQQNQTFEELTSIFQTCCEVPFNDGLTFDPNSVICEEIRKDQAYKGVRISIKGALGNAKIGIQVDIGFGDVITPGPIFIDYPTTLDGEPPSLKGYPLETVIAEKYHAMVVLDRANSRMKDFYDIWFICQSQRIFSENVRSAIQHTFNRRNTRVPNEKATAFTLEFSQNEDKQKQWLAFRTKIGDTKTPDSLEVVMEKIHQFLSPILKSIHEDNELNSIWKPDEGWVSEDNFDLF